MSLFEDLWIPAGNIVDVEDIAQVLGFARERRNWRRKKGVRFLEGGSQVQSRRQSGRSSQRR